MENWLLLSF